MRTVVAPLSLLLVILFVGACFNWDRLIEPAAYFLIDTSKPVKSDLIVVLGGNYDVRAPAAALLFREGWAPKIFLAREVPDAKKPSRENFTDTTIRILEADGVPKDRIIDFAPTAGVDSTADEVRAFKLFADTYPVRRILVVTSSFHSRRARMSLRRALPSSVEIRMIAADSPEYTPATWRLSASGRSQVRLEWIKMLYYFFTFYG